MYTYYGTYKLFLSTGGATPFLRRRMKAWRCLLSVHSLPPLRRLVAATTMALGGARPYPPRAPPPTDLEAGVIQAPADAGIPTPAPADVFAATEEELVKYDALEKELVAKYRDEEERRRGRQKARGGIVLDNGEPDDDDDYCYNEIRNLVLIERSVIHKTALGEWARKEKLFTARVERKTKKVSLLKNEVYQVIGFVSVFQGVVLTAVAQSNLLHCNNLWSPIVLSVLASVVAIAGVTQKLLQISSLQKTIVSEEDALKDAVRRGAALRNKGKDFVFGQLGKAKKRELKKEHVWWYTGSVLSFLCLFTLAFPLSHWRILCHPGPNPYNPSGA